MIFHLSGKMNTAPLYLWNMYLTLGSSIELLVKLQQQKRQPCIITPVPVIHPDIHRDYNVLNDEASLTVFFTFLPCQMWFHLIICKFRI